MSGERGRRGGGWVGKLRARASLWFQRFVYAVWAVGVASSAAAGDAQSPAKAAPAGAETSLLALAERPAGSPESLELTAIEALNAPSAAPQSGLRGVHPRLDRLPPRSEVPAPGPPSGESHPPGPTAEAEELPVRPAQPRTLLPWVGVENRTPRGLYREDPLGEARALLPPGVLFGDRDALFKAPPAYAFAPSPPALYIPPARKTRYAKAFERIARKKFYREARRMMKREWKQAFRELPSMRYEFFEERLQAIHHVGRTENPSERPSDEYFTNQLKDDVFRRTGREAEREFPLFAWGPFVLLDSGSMRLDPGRIIDPKFFDVFELDDEDRKVHNPILAARDYEIRTSFRLDVDPFKAGKESDVTWLIDRYALTVEVDWLSDVLGQRMLMTEVDLEFERNGDFAALVNFVITTRS